VAIHQHRIGILLLGVTTITAGCGSRGAYPTYDPDSRLVRRIDYDSDLDGLIEARVYYRNGRPVRLEADANGDGLVDRWEFYTASSALDRLGTASARDGRLDTWARTSGDDLQLDISTRRDGLIDRREFRRRGVLVRTEHDTNFDGLPDEWQRFEDGRLRELDLDTTLSTGRADRRLVYTSRGNLERTESVDAEGHVTPRTDGLR